MKIIVVLCFSIVLISGCKQAKNLEFCEGVSIKGDGVNCGIQFGTGDLTLIIKSKEPFGAGKILIEIYESGKKKKKVDSISVEVKPDQSKTTTTLSMHDTGKFFVKALNGKKVIAEDKIEIVDY